MLAYGLMGCKELRSFVDHFLERDFAPPRCEVWIAKDLTYLKYLVQDHPELEELNANLICASPAVFTIGKRLMSSTPSSSY